MNTDIVVFAALISIIFGFVGFLMYSSEVLRKEDTAICRSMGGHIKNFHRGYVCLSSDGRVLEP
jgi:hypothetical protein